MGNDEVRERQERLAALAERLEERLADPAADPGNMLGHVETLGEQLRRALEVAESIDLAGVRRPRQVLVLGMGGSAIGGELARSLTEGISPVPILVNRDYRLPAFVDKDTLVIASSYSGNTEETLHAYDEAKAAGAQLVAITTGGKLAQRAREAGVPLVTIPSGLQPRAALGYSLVPLLFVLYRVGLIADPSDDVREAAALLDERVKRLGRGAAPAGNEAKQLAVRLYDRLPVIYGSSGWKAAVAYRWKCQINENAKAMAAWHVLPEQNHNELVGWEAPPGLTRQAEVIMLKDALDPAPIRRRMEITAEIIGPRVSGIVEAVSEGRSDFARMMSLIQLGDLASVYLALLYGVDPSPVRVIDYLKGQLAR